jgi:hypothetical protein
MLTKTDFLLYLDCPLHLWAKSHGQAEEKKPNEHEKFLIKQGYEIEKLAQQFIEEVLMEEKYSSEATVSFQDEVEDSGYHARLDAFVHDPEKDIYDLYEIKSSISVDKSNKYDATFQHLLCQDVLPINKTYLLHLNGEYVKKGELNISKLFVVKDMSKDIEKLQDEVKRERAKALAVMNSNEPPKDEHCFKPNVCSCSQLCHPDLHDSPIYDLPYGNKKKYQSLLQMGCSSLVEIPDDFKLSLRQETLVCSAKQGLPVIKAEEIKKELNKLVYPLYFLDYETFNSALPLYNGHKPYQQIVFQYSLHILDSPDGELKHEEFLWLKNEDPSRAICEQLVKDVGTKGSVIVWNKGFEMGRNKELAEFQPKFAKQLLGVNKRVFDLMEVFSKCLYVDYKFHGSCSIKSVLPVLVPSLSYKDLTINQGDQAMMSWYDLIHGKMSKGKNFGVKKQAVAGSLLEYCKLDTLAMVEIWKHLVGVV